MMRNTEHKQLSFTRYIFLKLQYILFYADPGPTVYKNMRNCGNIDAGSDYFRREYLNRFGVFVEGPSQFYANTEARLFLFNTPVKRCGLKIAWYFYLAFILSALNNDVTRSILLFSNLVYFYSWGKLIYLFINQW